jgi:hypothetical protein
MKIDNKNAFNFNFDKINIKNNLNALNIVNISKIDKLNSIYLNLNALNIVNISKIDKLNSIYLNFNALNIPNISKIDKLNFNEQIINTNETDIFYLSCFKKIKELYTKYIEINNTNTNSLNKVISAIKTDILSLNSKEELDKYFKEKEFKEIKEIIKNNNIKTYFTCRPEWQLIKSVFKYKDVTLIVNEFAIDKIIHIINKSENPLINDSKLYDYICLYNDNNKLLLHVIIKSLLYIKTYDENYENDILKKIKREDKQTGSILIYTKHGNASIVINILETLVAENIKFPNRDIYDIWQYDIWQYTNIDGLYKYLDKITVINDLDTNLNNEKITDKDWHNIFYKKIINIGIVQKSEMINASITLIDKDKSFKYYKYNIPDIDDLISYNLTKKYWYKYYNRSPQCAKNRLIQFDGTCWLNSILNALFLGEYSRLLLFKKINELSYNLDELDYYLDELDDYLDKLGYYLDDIESFFQKLNNDKQNLKKNLKNVFLAMFNEFVMKGKKPNEDIITQLSYLVKHNCDEEFITKYMNNQYKIDYTGIGFFPSLGLLTVIQILDLSESNILVESSIFIEKFIENTINNNNNKDLIIFVLEKGLDFKDINNKIPTYFKDFELDSSLCRNKSHTICGLRCNELEYIYDSNNIIASTDWIKMDFSGYYDALNSLNILFKSLFYVKVLIYVKKIDIKNIYFNKILNSKLIKKNEYISKISKMSITFKKKNNVFYKNKFIYDNIQKNYSDTDILFYNNIKYNYLKKIDVSSSKIFNFKSVYYKNDNNDHLLQIDYMKRWSSINNLFIYSMTIYYYTNYINFEFIEIKNYHITEDLKIIIDPIPQAAGKNNRKILYNNRKYKVYKNKNGLYIKPNNEKKYLKDIKNKYKNIYT